MTPRARLHRDRGGDPLDGLVNLFDIGVVLAVAFLLAALSSLKLTDLLTREDVTVVRSGARDQTVIVKRGDRVQTLRVDPVAARRRARQPRGLGLPPRRRPPRLRPGTVVVPSVDTRTARATGDHRVAASSTLEMPGGIPAGSTSLPAGAAGRLDGTRTHDRNHSSWTSSGTA